MVNDTSLCAYREIKQTINNKQKKVFKIIHASGKAYPSNKDIAWILGRPINCVTPRVFELRAKGLIVDAGIRIDHETKRLVHTWKAAEFKKSLF